MVPAEVDRVSLSNEQHLLFKRLGCPYIRRFSLISLRAEQTKSSKSSLLHCLTWKRKSLCILAVVAAQLHPQGTVSKMPHSPF